MTTRQLLTTTLLALIAELTLLAVILFLAEPEHAGGSAPRFHDVDVAYVAVPFVLIAAAAFLPLRALVRRRREQV
jgi:hypothetical protein